MFTFKTAGRLHCPRCFCMQEFAVVVGCEKQDAPPVECTVCDYRFEKVRVEHGNGQDELVDPLSMETRMKALTEHREDFKRNAVANGYRLENFTRGRRSS